MKRKKINFMGFTKQLSFVWLVILAALILLSCEEQGKKEKPVEKLGKDTSALETGKTTPETKEEKQEKEYNLIERELKKVSISSDYNNIAKFLAGIDQEKENELSGYQDSSVWKKYSRILSNRWARLERGKLKKISDFRDKELKEVTVKTKTLFYPFSGPDFLHAYYFFPHAQRYVMIGLESVGSLPYLYNMVGDSAMIKYFGNVAGALKSVLAISFFLTKDMKVDFNEELDGVLPVLLIFAARTGHQIIDICAVHTDANGNLKYNDDYSDFPDAWGIEISLVDKYGEHKKIDYFSKNLADWGLPKGSAFVKYIHGLGNFTTYLKAASYLMHKDKGFDNIRNIILSQSDYLLQDDSGIPLKFFNENKWQLHFYGTYTRPIELFEERFQEDLYRKYHDSLREPPPPLGFGIGYMHRKGTSNLMYAKKIKNR